jgi:dTDP-4-dehydrorhamnose 3,5-epimerase
MTIKETPLRDLLILEPTIFADERGYFFESFRASLLEERGYSLNFVQDNESKSDRGVVRGLHMQAPPHAQDKLLRVVSGAIYDVAVDLRWGSPTYGQYFGLELNESNKSMLFVPKGFAHGFACLKDQTVVQYKCSNYYHKASECGIAWNDPTVGINWPVTEAVLSEKDLALPLLKDFKSPFFFN